MGARARQPAQIGWLMAVQTMVLLILHDNKTALMYMMPQPLHGLKSATCAWAQDFLHLEGILVFTWWTTPDATPECIGELIAQFTLQSLVCAKLI